MTNNEEILWDYALNKWIDESLRVSEDRSLGITMETVATARKYIQCEDFDIWHKILHGRDSKELVKMLRMMWVELARNPGRSGLFRSFFNPDVGGLHEMEGICLKHPEDWFWTRLTGFIDKWQTKQKNIEAGKKYLAGELL